MENSRPRLKILMPNSSSTSLRAAERLGWEMKSRLAAVLTERHSAIARMYLIC